MVRLYIIRHGETEPNTRYACLGRLDVPLNKNGVAQSFDLCGRIDDICPDLIYISPLKRAYQTIEPYLKKHPSIPIVNEYGIIERDFGDWDNMSFDEIQKFDPVRFRKWQSDFTGYAVPNGESSIDVQKRVNLTIDKITAENYGKSVFLITHLGTARHIISHLLNLNLDAGWRFTLNNAAYAVIDYDNNTLCGVLKYLNI